MPYRGDGLVLRGKTWWLDFYHNGERHRVRIVKRVSRTVAAELEAIQRAKILKGEVGIGKKRKDLLYDEARDEFLKWARANKKSRTVTFYESCFNRLNQSFKGEMLSQIPPILHRETQAGAA